MSVGSASEPNASARTASAPSRRRYLRAVRGPGASDVNWLTVEIQPLVIPLRDVVSDIILRKSLEKGVSDRQAHWSVNVMQLQHLSLACCSSLIANRRDADRPMAGNVQEGLKFNLNVRRI